MHGELFLFLMFRKFKKNYIKTSCFLKQYETIFPKLTKQESTGDATYEISHMTLRSHSSGLLGCLPLFFLLCELF